MKPDAACKMEHRENERLRALLAEMRLALMAALERIPNEHDFDHTPSDDDARAQVFAILLKSESTTLPEKES